MKSLYFIITFLVFTNITIQAQDYKEQRYDRQRVMMPAVGGGCPNLDTSDHVSFNGVKMDFQSDSLALIPVDTFVQGARIPYWSFNSASQICNRSGDFMAYFNGGELWDRYKHDSLLRIFRSDPNQSDYPAKYGISNSLILPYPGHDSTYMLLCVTKFRRDDIYNVLAGEGITAVTFVENERGRLDVVQEAVDFFTDKFTYNGSMTACRHANGRDWWIVSPRRWSKVFNFFLLDPGGIHYSHSQEVSDTILDFSFSPVFSPDGRWYTRTDNIHITQTKKIGLGQIYGFDRCEGRFTEVRSFSMPAEDTTGSGQILFDKSSRYFYVLNTNAIWQGEIDSPDLFSSMIKICQYDATIKDHGLFNLMFTGFLAPDGKMYIFDGNNNFGTSVIHRPSERGLACDARYASLWKPSCTGGFCGNMPDFNMGPIDGTICDSLGLDGTVSIPRVMRSITPLEVYPYPSTGHLTVHLPSQGGLLVIRDMKGQHIEQRHIADLQMQVNLELPSGIYIIQYVSHDGKIRSIAKAVVLK